MLSRKNILENINNDLAEVRDVLDLDINEDTYSFSMAHYDNSKSLRYTYQIEGNDDEKTPSIDNKTNSELISMVCGNKKFIVISSNPNDALVLFAANTNYLVSMKNVTLDANTISTLGEFDVCLMLGIDLDRKELLEKHGIKVIIIDLTSLHSDFNPEHHSLLDLSSKMAENGIEDPLEKINSKIFDIYNKSKAETHNDVNVAIDNKPIATIDNKNILEEEQIDEEEKTKESMKPQIEIILLSDLIIDPHYQTRKFISQEAIDNLRTSFINGDDIEPIDVVRTDDGKNIVVNGFHRYAGAEAADFIHIMCNVTNGTELDAFVLALGANSKNKALRRTNDDKRNAVYLALSNDELKDRSNRDIAKICNVSSTMVDKIYKELHKDEELPKTEPNANVCTKSDIDIIPDDNKELQKDVNTHKRYIDNDYIALSIYTDEKINDDLFIHLENAVNEELEKYYKN